jgi:hypothetical protein
MGQTEIDGAAAVYELDSRHIDWSPVKGLVIDVHRIIRVNRQAGSDAGRIRIWDTFFQKLKSFQGEVRDTSGRVLFSAGLPQVRAVAPFSEFRLYSGDVVRAVDLVAPQPPYEIEARWTVEIDNGFFWPDWAFEDSWPRREAIYEVASPIDRQVRFREAVSGLERRDDQQARRQVTKWTLHNWVPSDSDITVMGSHTLLQAAPEEFRVGHLRGRTDSWDALGRWYWSLTKDQIKLREDQAYYVQRQVRDKVGERAKASALKDWVSDQWRYVAIEVGLGGWRPAKAQDVYASRYGDCKDMVFLWIAMLRQIGVTAYPALVRARNPLPIDPDFPKDWFDHVIAMTVINGDTLWADMSDSRYPLGTLPRACESREALVVGDFGGRLLRTPDRSAAHNVLVTRSNGTLDANGDLRFDAQIEASGHFARRFPLQGRWSPQLAAAVFLGVSTPSCDASLDSINVLSSDAIQAYLHGTIRGWALPGPRQIVIRPCQAGWVSADTLGGRPDPATVDFTKMVYDTLVVRVPDGWVPEFWPQAEAVSDSLGEFRETREFLNSNLTITRFLTFDAPSRILSQRRASARLRAAYRDAENTEWLFRRGSESDSLGGQGQ